ncbi:SUMO1 sentrin specific peptidase 8 [Coemansia interrupta]|uniref:SUMO1 sentrin specific peptidase 8 n=1 Tax=Coemansia interrupta TaxID=1126814 RepID=A0A9W8H769_9FUNG|nr:SUMO1 sentrin specific peptidase 8 [Coemansia interrupta]
MADSILFSYHDSTLFTSDPLTLHDGKWLNDAILSFYFEYLANEVLRGDSTIMFLKPALVQCLRLQQDLPSLQSALPPDMHTKHIIFIPINDGDDVFVQGGSGSHWSLLVCSRTTRGAGLTADVTFHYFDSAANANYQVALAVKAKLEMLLGESHRQIITHSCPQQENGYDCGVFVILFADILARRYADLRLPPRQPSPQNGTRSVAIRYSPPLVPIAAGYSMLASANNDLIRRVMSPFAVPAADAPAVKYREFRPAMLQTAVIRRTFWWIDYGDLCNPNKARRTLRKLIDEHCAIKRSPLI